MNIEHELNALHRNLKSALGTYYVTVRQVGALICLIQQGLPSRNRELRIAVLRAWIGEPMMTMHGIDVQSTKNITGPMASFLINLLKTPNTPEIVLSDYGLELIEETVKYVQANGTTSQVLRKSTPSAKIQPRVDPQAVGP